MASPALFGAQRLATGGRSGSSGLNLLTSHSSANTKGSYSELIASTAFNASAVMIHAINSNGLDYLIDLAIGAGGSEQVIVDNILYTADSTNGFCHRDAIIPIHIPAGSRIAARCQNSSGASRVVAFGITLIGGGVLPFGGLGRATTYGANTADSGATSVDPGGTANTKGAYSQLTAATTAPINWLVICTGQNADTARATCNWLMDIAIGAGGSEQIVIPDYPLSCHAAYDFILPGWMSLPVSIPTGSRIAARASCSINTAGDRLFDVAVIGV